LGERITAKTAGAGGLPNPPQGILQPGLLGRGARLEKKATFIFSLHAETGGEATQGEEGEKTTEYTYPIGTEWGGGEGPACPLAFPRSYTNTTWGKGE